MKPALICGVTGQDGAYLAAHLLHRGCRVVGTSRLAEPDISRLRRLGIAARVETIRLDLLDARAVRTVVRDLDPAQIYNLAGQSSVGHSFAAPLETATSIVDATLHLLEAVRTDAPDARLCNAGSGEMYGELAGVPATEDSPLRPVSPYAAAKAAAFLLVASYRRSFGLFAATAILFNHESPLRGDQFVTRKICDAVRRIAGGSAERLRLGPIDMYRDWGWSPEYVEGMTRILAQPVPQDVILASGRSECLADFVAAAFSARGLNWHDHVDIDEALKRPADIAWSGADPSRAAELLGWRAKIPMAQVARWMVDAPLQEAVV